MKHVEIEILARLIALSRIGVTTIMGNVKYENSEALCISLAIGRRTSSSLPYFSLLRLCNSRDDLAVVAADNIDTFLFAFTIANCHVYRLSLHTSSYALRHCGRKEFYFASRSLKSRLQNYFSLLP